MAITKLVTGCSLGIEVQKGVDKLGDPIYTKKTFSNVNPSIGADDYFEVASAIEKVLDADCRNYIIIDSSKLMNE